MRAIVFSSEAECLAFQSVLLERIPHIPAWVPFVPLKLLDNSWAAQIADTLLPNLEADETAQIVTVDPALIPQPGPRPLP